MSQEKCPCGKVAENTCANCARSVCDDTNCVTETVDGTLCGTYTQWGCARKYTNCEICMNDLAMHEGDMVCCEECNILMCEECMDEHACEEEEEVNEENAKAD